MARFRKKPVVIEASQWLKNGDHPEDYIAGQDGFENGEIRTFSGDERKPTAGRLVSSGIIAPRLSTGKARASTAPRSCTIMDGSTLEGGHIVCPGDFVITGVKGERYPCKPDIFAATYEAAE